MLQSSYDTPLVLISVFVAIFASYTALNMAGRVASASGRTAIAWLIGGAIAMGTGIWSMHFIGMLAFKLPIPIGYDFWITALSWLLPIVASALALWLVSRPLLPTSRLIGGAFLIGLGINSMHYMGMAAMRMRPGIDFDTWLVIASLAIAIGAAGLALWIAYRLRAGRPDLWKYRASAAIVMGGAIAGMHYTGMAAASFPIGSVCLAAGSGVGGEVLAMIVIIATMSVLVVALLTSIFDAKLELRAQILAITEAQSEERKTLLQNEQAAREEAERLGKLKDEFLATLSHKLRTPLNAILGWTQLLQLNDADSKRIAQGLETIERNARAQAQLIDELLDMNRIESGNLRLEIQPLTDFSFVHRAVESIRPTAREHRIEITEVIGPLNGQLDADPDRLQQVVSNLLANAIKFTPANGKVLVATAQAGNHVEISVTDSGIGMSADFLHFAFDRFRQAESATTRRHRGLGLGLSIVKQLVELHGGTVHASSPGPDQGSRFVIRLPVHSTAARPIAAERSDATQQRQFRRADLAGICALVVDDEPDARAFVKQLLEDCEADVLLAANADEALEVLAKRKPDVLISDIGMPDTDGYELLRRIRAMKSEAADIKAIATTAFTRTVDEERALQSGFDAFVRKPVEPDQLLQQIAVLIARV